MPCSRLADTLLGAQSSQLLLVDVRPSTQHCSKHIRHSENINFSNILLRRLLKGVVQLNAMVPSQELAEKLACRDSKRVGLVVYDSCSRRDAVRAELLRHAEVLAKTGLGKDSDRTVYFLDGECAKLAKQQIRLIDINRLCLQHALINHFFYCLRWT